MITNEDGSLHSRKEEDIFILKDVRKQLKIHNYILKAQGEIETNGLLSSL